MTCTALPSRALKCISAYFLGLLLSGEYILAVMDYYSIYVEVAVTRSVAAAKVIKQLNIMFHDIFA
jgi:hypothetical protein